MYVGISKQFVRRNRYEMYEKSNRSGKIMGLHTIKNFNEKSQKILCSFTNKTTNNQSKYSPRDNLSGDKQHR